ncbi:MAG: hypothetical protein C0508_30860, partial [Cyanobacteria bacterium PR.023]|nr:hypothetical protein [Cyanobacteria bacterium PR.023]
MAELRVEAKYKTAVGRAAFTVMCTLFPFWALVAPAVLGYVIGSTFMHPEAKAFAETAATCLTLIGSILVGLLGTAVSEDNRLLASKSGLAFPLFLLPHLLFRRNRNWSDLNSASLLSDGEKRQLTLNFTSGGFLVFDMAKFETKQ